MAHWTLDDIPWQAFDAAKTDPEMISMVKASAMVEHNGRDYARYLREVFAGNPELYPTIDQWADEEVQHGCVLRKWAELADPEFDFDRSFAMFTAGYQLPAGVQSSVRGSLSGEMVARCVVESGTSTHYTALREYTQEPVLKAICAKIAADEFRHYKLFYDMLKDFQHKDKLGLAGRLRVALGRVAESEDDELAYAYYSALSGSAPQPAYDRQTYTRRYMAVLRKMYRRKHLENLSSMIFKAVGLKPHTKLFRLSSAAAWGLFRLRTRHA